MNHKDNSGLFGCRPILFVDSVARSLSYYVDILGFHLGLAWSEQEQAFVSKGDLSAPTFAIIGRGPVQLMLSQRSQGAPGMWLHFDIHTADQVDVLYREWSGKGARIIEPPSMRAWGMYEMRVGDPDGHVFRISGPPRTNTREGVGENRAGDNAS
jgi:uncharacterized glyoxalase superfamily protein PhnB